MTQNIKNAVNLTNYLFSMPDAKYTLLGIFLLGIIFGLISNIYNYSGLDLILRGSIDGLFVLSLPALLSAATIKLMIRKVKFKSIAATTFAGEILYALSYLISLFISGIAPEYSTAVVFIGSAIVFVLWYYIARLIFVLKWRALLFAIVQLIFHSLFLLSSKLIDFGAEPEAVIFKFYLSSFILLGAIYFLFTIINAPMKRNFGFTSLDAFSMFMAQWLYEKKDIEKAFTSVGEKAKTILSFFLFRRKNDNILFLTPYVHFGPFGNLGGSQFSYLLAEYGEQKHNSKTFVFHGTVTHDLNPTSSDQISKIKNEIDLCFRSVAPSAVKTSFRISNEEECQIECLSFGNDSFLGLTRAPKLTEDMNFGIGLSLIHKAENYSKNAAIVDQHNSETGDITSFEPSDPVGYRYLLAIEKLFSKKPKENPLQIGVSQRTPSAQFIGSGGVKCALFSTSPEYLLVWLDSNGISPTFRNRIIKEVKELGKKYKHNWEVGVYTTDTHEVNTVQGVMNPLKNNNEILEEIKTGALEAMYDLQPAKFYSCKKWFDINVLGSKQSIEIVSTVNSIIAVSKIAAPIVIFGSVLAIIWVLSKF